ARARSAPVAGGGPKAIRCGGVTGVCGADGRGARSHAGEASPVASPGGGGDDASLWARSAAAAATARSTLSPSIVSMVCPRRGSLVGRGWGKGESARPETDATEGPTIVTVLALGLCGAEDRSASAL